MCKCTPMVKNPFCGKGDCQWPEQQCVGDTPAAESVNFNNTEAFKTGRRLGKQGDINMLVDDSATGNNLLPVESVKPCYHKQPEYCRSCMEEKDRRIAELDAANVEFGKLYLSRGIEIQKLERRIAELEYNAKIHSQPHDHQTSKIYDLERQLKEANEQGKQMTETANRAIHNLEQQLRDLRGKND